ncbi:hypothetical protein G6F56_013093 [Rhizopus delemar]|nr:hypothetical protein G6F56_013093 [Rhizopus delemar]
MMCSDTPHYNAFNSTVHGQDTPFSHPTNTHHTTSASSSSIPIKIGLWNANGLTGATAQDFLQHCTSFSILFITETWLRPPRRIDSSWSQFHVYGPPVPNSFRGSQVPGSYPVWAGPVSATHLPVFAPFLV